MSKEILKIIISGDGGVGKTTLLHRYINNNYESETEMTKGLGFFSKDITIDEKEYQLVIWDLGGQYQFSSIFATCSLLEGAVGALVLFDLTRYITCNKLSFWIDLISQYGNFPILIVGSKLDMVNGNIGEFDKDISQLLEKYDNCFDYIKASSLTGENVEKTFQVLTKGLFQKQFISE